MFNNNYFYFATLRKITVVFGSLFDDVKIQRKEADGTAVKTISVPIQYAPRRAYLVKLNEGIASATINIQNTLPRLSYEITGLEYEGVRKNNTFRYQTKEDVSVSQYLKQYSPVPYNLTFDLNLYTQYIDDSLQVLEQIIPYFSPNITVTIDDIPELDMLRDIPITLDSIAPQVEYEGIIGDDDRILITTLSFSAKVFLYPPIRSIPVIKRVKQNIITNDNEKVDVLITTEVDPIDANYNDDWTIKETIEEF